MVNYGEAESGEHKLVQQKDEGLNQRLKVPNRKSLDDSLHDSVFEVSKEPLMFKKDVISRFNNPSTAIEEFYESSGDKLVQEST